MTDARSGRLSLLLEEALACPRETREAFLAQRCADDEAMRNELRSLMAAHDAADGYFENVAEQIVLPALAAVADSNDRVTADAIMAKLQAALGDAYRVERSLSGGGMSRVYVAEEVRLARKVVVKVLPEEMRAGVDVARFTREIQLSARLQHPHIVPVLAADAAADLLYYTMPLVAGETLRARIAREGPLPVKDAVAIWRDMLDALGYAHRSGVIHRDVKPGNILLDGRHALVADFGIARAVAAASDDASSTVTGLALGTPAYMAPEQATAERDVDHRLDIYAAGVVMYEMLAGHGPFPGLSLRELLMAHLTREPPPLDRADAPPALTALVLECLAKDREARPPDADAIVQRLEHVLLPSGAAAVTHERSWPRWSVALAAVVLLLVVTIFSRSWQTSGKPIAQQGTLADADARSNDTRPSLAVLPLEALSADSLSDYLADVLTAALIERFTQGGELRVIQGPSAFFFKGHRTPPARIADSLGVTNVLSGAVHHEGSAIRVLLRLNSGKGAAVGWTRTYKGQRENVFALEDSISASVARELLPNLASAVTVRRRRQRPDPLTYELYRRGMYEESHQGADALRKAIGFLNQAVARDSTFAEAYAALADAYGLFATGNLTDMPVRVSADSALYFAGRALALDDSLPSAYHARAFVRMLTYDWGGADADVRRTVEIDPYAGTIRYALSTWRGDFAKAVAEMRLDLASDPMSSNTRGELARALLFNGDNASALAQLDSTTRLVGGRLNPRVYLTLGEIRLSQHRARDAISAFERFRQGAGDSPSSLAFLSIGHASDGNRTRATEILNELIARWRKGKASACFVAMAYAGLHDYDNAFSWLDRAVADRSLRPLLMSPTFVDLRADPRFEQLMRRIGLRS